MPNKGENLSFFATGSTVNGLSRKRLSIIIGFWIAATISLICMAHYGPAGWDAGVYWNAAKTLQVGGDPYAEGIAAQEVFHNRPVHHPNEHVPFTYVYSPLTLPVLRLLARVPGTFMAWTFGGMLAAGFLMQLWAGFQMAGEKERLPLMFMLPVLAFFPGLLCNDVILSGNIVYLLYGLIFAAAVPGWKRDRWLWYYIAVLAASVCKAPLLTLLAFPVLVGRRQWVPAGIAGAVGSLLFAVPAWLWPEQFREYLRAVALQFEWNYDFGFSPSGILGTALHRLGLPYHSPSTIFYLAFAGTAGLLLLYLANRVRQGYLSREMWIPVAAVGTILLNPRIKEYDVAAITIPMILICWRTLSRFLTPTSVAGSDEGALGRLHLGRTVVLVASGWFLALNFTSDIHDASWEAVFPTVWRCLEGVMLLGIFGSGIWGLLKDARVEQPRGIGSRVKEPFVSVPEVPAFGAGED